MIFGEENSAAPQSQQRIRLDVSQMETVYANFFAIAGSSDEITLYLGANSPLPEMREPAVRVSHRLMLLPQNAKRLLIALQQTVKAHEDRFGPIEIAMPKPPDGQRPG